MNENTGFTGNPMNRFTTKGGGTCLIFWEGRKQKSSLTPVQQWRKGKDINHTELKGEMDRAYTGLLKTERDKALN